MKYLSLFSGIGGFELGIEKAYEQLCHAHGSENRGSETNQTGDEGQRLLSEKGRGASTKERSARQRLADISHERPLCVGYSEIDKYAAQIYQSHFPTHKNYGDITKINAKELPDFDLLVGGFPCQAFSIAGKRGGFSDTRGTLFFEIARIVKEKLPRLLLLENVKGLLSHDNGRTFRTIIATLDELGYDIQWQVLNSKNHGVPQNRERVYIVGHLRGTRRPEVFPFYGSDAETGASIRRIAHMDGYRRYNQVYENEGSVEALDTAQGGGHQPCVLVPEAVIGGGTKATVGDSINLAIPNSKTRRGRVGKGIAQTLDTGMQQFTLTSDMRIRRLTPVECERLQAFPDHWTSGLSDSKRYKCCGNAVTVNVVRDVVIKLLQN